ncbi:DivIVA domain-containing protein [Bacillota bacterium LX-D]|nr:DivIVA domain-containing protein [Bacillota bacterium LX-D]
MLLTPLDIQNKEFRKVLRGYSEEEVNVFLARVLRDYEQMYSENQQLKEQIKSITLELDHFKQIEGTLNQTMIIAQQTAEEVKENARKECELLAKENQLAIQQLIKEAEQKVLSLEMEYEKVRKNFQGFKAQMKGLLVAQLEMLNEDEQAELKQELA